MQWINLGYDFRVPLSKNSSWQVGDLGMEEFSKLLGVSRRKIQEIVSFDLNLSPRPRAVFSNRPGSVDLNYGAYASGSAACARSSCDDIEGTLIFWQVEENAYLRAKKQGWFDFLPEETPVLPNGWLCIGLDVVNDQGVSEYWDITEEFWELDHRLIDSVNQYGLVPDERLIFELQPSLPLNPANSWAMVVRAWIARC